MHSPLYQYDLALFDRIHSLYDEVFFADVDEQFITNAREHQGKVVMPFIGISRLPDFSINYDFYNDSQVRRGWTNLGAKDQDGVEFAGKKVMIHSLPVMLQYQVDVYATKRDVCDGLISELIMEFHERPYLRVQFMDLGDVIQEFQIAVEDGVTDNTDVSGFSETNRFYRKSITINIDHAYIYRVDKALEIEKITIDVNDLSLDKKEIEKVRPKGEDSGNGGKVVPDNRLSTDGISPGVRSKDDLNKANEEINSSDIEIKR